MNCERGIILIRYLIVRSVNIFVRTQNDFVAHMLPIHEKPEIFACTRCELDSKKKYGMKWDFQAKGNDQVDNS